MAILSSTFAFPLGGGGGDAPIEPGSESYIRATRRARRRSNSLPPVERAKIDGVVGRVLERHYTLLTAIRAIPQLDGVLIEDVQLTDSFSVVYHNLGRRPAGFSVLTMNTASTVYENKSNRTDNELVLRATNAVTVDLWVF